MTEDIGKRMVVEGEGLINIFHEVFRKNMQYMLRFFSFIWVVTIIILFVMGHYDYDNTDTADGTRSGMKLRTDHQTKCQYLETDHGGITPRLNSRGEHMCGQHLARP